MRKDFIFLIILLGFIIIPQTGMASNTIEYTNEKFNFAYENVTTTYTNSYEVDSSAMHPAVYMDTLYLQNSTHIQKWNVATGQSLDNHSISPIYPYGVTVESTYLTYLQYDSLENAYFLLRYDLQSLELVESIECTCFGSGYQSLLGLTKYGSEFVTVQASWGENPNIIRFQPEGNIIQNNTIDTEGFDIHGEVSLKFAFDAYWITANQYVIVVNPVTFEMEYVYEIENAFPEVSTIIGIEVQSESVWLLVSVYNEVTFESRSYIYEYNVDSFIGGAAEIDADVAANSGFSAAMGAVGAATAGVAAAATMSSVASFAATGQISLFDRIKALFNLRKLFGRKKEDEDEKEEFQKPSFTPGFVGLFLIGVPLGIVGLIASGRIFSDAFAWLVALFGPIGMGWSIFGLIATVLIIHALQRKLVPEMTIFGKILLIVGICTSAYGLFGSMSSSYLLLSEPVFSFVAIVMLGLGFLMSWNTYSVLLQKYKNEEESSSETLQEDTDVDVVLEAHDVKETEKEDETEESNEEVPTS